MLAVSSRTHNCGACARPAPDSAICAECAKLLEVTLVNIAAYAGELDLVRARMVRFSQRVGRVTERPLPVDLRVAPVVAAVRNALSGWVRIVAEWRPEVYGPTCSRSCAHRSCRMVHGSRLPADTVPSMCLWLTLHVSDLALSDAADECLDELLACQARMRRLIDRPLDRWYAGICSTPGASGGSCPVDLYAVAGALQVTCPGCRTVHDVAQRRETLLAAAEDVYATAAEIVGAVTTLAGESLSPATIRTWVHRKRLIVRGVNHDARQLYRVGDVLDLLLEQSRAKARKAS